MTPEILNGPASETVAGSHQNRLSELMARYQEGRRSTFHLGPFLSTTALRDRGLSFNDAFRDKKTMAAAARLNFELGFESTVLPFDMNVEAEMLGAHVRYHEGFEGHPVYPTISRRPVKGWEDVAFSGPIERRGRMPVVLNAILSLKRNFSHEGAVGAFMPGPFTLAGQVMEPEKLFMMLIKEPDTAEKILMRLSDFIMALKSLYANAGVDFITVEEGGASAVSPRIFGSLLLPHLQNIFAQKPCPMAISMVGGTEQFLDFLLACGADAVQVDRGCDTAFVSKKNPDHLPLFTGCGVNDMLAKGDPETVASAVRERLDQGATGVAPPADIYPAARMENIQAFINALRRYEEA
ncbi:MAG: hypothetical protein LJE96_18485 [Deltaproteobacteria bacterium]|nr:hypothetical protein [Deltaproteobacteria bacterium]